MAHRLHLDRYRRNQLHRLSHSAQEGRSRGRAAYARSHCGRVSSSTLRSGEEYEKKDAKDRKFLCRQSSAGDCLSARGDSAGQGKVWRTKKQMTEDGKRPLPTWRRPSSARKRHRRSLRPYSARSHAHDEHERNSRTTRRRKLPWRLGSLRREDDIRQGRVASSSAQNAWHSGERKIARCRHCV